MQEREGESERTGRRAFKRGKGVQERERGEDVGEWRVCEREGRVCETETGERESVCGRGGRVCERKWVECEKRVE